MKRIFLLALSLFLLASLVACTDAKQYANDVSPTALAEAALNKMDDGVAYTTAEKGFLDDYFTEPSYLIDSVIRFATDANNLNEFGIFRVESGKAKEMGTLLENYLKDSLTLNQSWYDSYIPEETPKLRDAEVKVFGDYAVYAIADKTDRQAFFAAVESELTK